jgi:hypothetical protein
MTWKHPHCPVKKKFKTVQSAGKVMTSIFWGVYALAYADITVP